MMCLQPEIGNGKLSNRKFWVQRTKTKTFDSNKCDIKPSFILAIDPLALFIS